MSALIELKDITFSYEKDKENVFFDFSLKIDAGECVCVMGDNGSGKTTLFRILNGLSFPTDGSYMFDGRAITASYLKDNRNAKTFHKRIGYLFQNPDIMLFNGSVYDEIAFGPRQMGLGAEEVDRRTLDCMGLFDIINLRDKAPYHLSGGQKKRVAFAAVMALNPEVIVLDEPFAGLDQKTAAQVMELLFKLKEGKKTIIIATHNETAANELADRKVLLDAD